MLLENTPTPTKNLHKAREDLDKYGFCLVPDALNAKEIATSPPKTSAKYAMTLILTLMLILLVLFFFL